jgi:ribosomal protein S6--L-glutamate ligase
MYERALESRGVSTTWVEMPDMLSSIKHVSGASLYDEAMRNPYAVRVAAEEYSLAADAHGLCEGTLAIIASDIHGPYAPVIAAMLSRLGVTQPNSPQSLRMANDKWITHGLFRDAGLPVPRAELAHDLIQARDLANDLGYPLVVKELEGTQGLGVRLAHNEDELVAAAEELEIFRQPLLLEHYIECGSADKRIVMMNHVVLAAMERHAVSGDFRANIALGGIGEYCTVSDYELMIVRKAADLVGLRLVGMDIGIVKEVLPGREYLPLGTPFLIEPNAMPGLSGLRDATHIDATQIIVDALLVDLVVAERPVA